MLASGNWEGTTIELFDVIAGAGLRTIHERLQGVCQPGGTAFFSASGKLLTYPVPEGVAVWDVLAGRLLGTLLDEDTVPLGFDAWEEGVLVESSKGVLRWAFKEFPSTTVTNLGLPALLESRRGGSAASADGRICAATTTNGWRLARTDSFGEQSRIVTPPDSFGMTLGPDGARFAIGARFSLGVKVWDVRTGTLLKELPVDAGHGEPSSSVAFSADGGCLATSTVNEYCFWDVSSWSIIRRIPQEPGNDFPAMMAFSRDGKVFAGTHSRNIVRLYNAANGQVLADLETPSSKLLTSLSFNEDGTLLAACESRDRLRVWDLRVIREELAAMNLDWEMPAYPPRASVAPLGTNSFTPPVNR